MSKLPKLLPNTRRSLFTDDFMIYSESSLSDLIQSNLQTSMDDLTLTPIIVSSYAVPNLLGCPLKGKRATGSNHERSFITARSSLLLHLLGSFTFDSVLTFRSHFRIVDTLARHRHLKMNSIFSSLLFSSTYGPATSTLIRLDKSYIRSLFDYGVPATCVASPYVQLSWERVQTHFISRTLSIPSFNHNDRKRQHAYLPPIHVRNMYLPKRWYRCAMQHNRGVQDYIDNHTHDKRNIHGSRTTPLELISN